ncbi:hypothetical protein D3C76_1287990 [compost metagenome]
MGEPLHQHGQIASVSAERILRQILFQPQRIEKLFDEGEILFHVCSCDSAIGHYDVMVQVSGTLRLKSKQVLRSLRDEYWSVLWFQHLLHRDGRGENSRHYWPGTGDSAQSERRRAHRDGAVRRSDSWHSDLGFW